MTSQTLGIATPAATLGDVLITSELAFRNRRAADLRTENAALHMLADALVEPPESQLDKVLAVALKLCDAGSAGISIVLDSAPEVYTWIKLDGEYKSYVGGTTPRGFSPCGHTAQSGQPQLFYYPARLFSYLRATHPPIVEGLVIPFDIPEKPRGTVWIVSHSEESKCDEEDVRIMTGLAAFAAAAVHRMDRTRG